MRSLARRSATVTLTLLSGTAAAVLSACQSANDRHCVDPQDRVVPDSLCTNTGVRTHSGGGWYPYRYYYGGRGYRGIGSALLGGSYLAPGRSYGGTDMHAGGGTTRGGFGGIGAGHGFSGS